MVIYDIWDIFRFLKFSRAKPRFVLTAACFEMPSSSPARRFNSGMTSESRRLTSH